MTHDSSKHFLVASDFDQTLSFNDSGTVLSELIGASDFQEKVDGLARSNLVQQGGELAYLIRHDPEFRGVRREHLIETGRRVRLRSNIPALVDFLERGVDGYRFSFFVISAAPREVIQSALEGIVAPDAHLRHRAGVRPSSGEVQSIAPRARRLRQGRGGRGAGGPPRHRARSDDLHRRRQLGRPRHAARQQPRRLHHRRLGEPAAGADRAAARPERRRLRASIVPVLDEVLGWGVARDPRAVRVLRPDAAGVGEGADRPGHGRRRGDARSRNGPAVRSSISGGRRRRSSSAPTSAPAPKR